MQSKRVWTLYRRTGKESRSLGVWNPRRRRTLEESSRSSLGVCPLVDWALTNQSGTGVEFWSVSEGLTTSVRQPYNGGPRGQGE